MLHMSEFFIYFEGLLNKINMNLKKIWSDLSNNGVKPEHDFNETKRIRILNRFSIIGIYIAFSYTIFLLILSEPVLALLDFNIVVAGVIVMVLLKYFNYRIAATFMFISIPLTLLLLNIFYGKVGGEFYFFSLFILAYYVFTKKKLLVPILIYMIVVFMLSKHFSVSITPEGMAKTLAPYFYYINLACTFIIAAIFLQLFVTEHLHYQRQIEEKNSNIREAYDIAIEQNNKISMLLRELNHRTKNNLQLVSSLISIQSNKITNEAAKKALEESNNRIHSLSLIYQKLYEKDNNSQFTLKEYVNELVLHYQNTFSMPDKKISFVQNIDDFEVNMDDATTLGLLINELITNAIKHSEIKDSIIKITLWAKKKTSNSMQIKIQNSGTGISKIFTHDNNSSFGTKLIHILTKQMNGTVSLDNDNENCLEINVQLSQEI